MTSATETRERLAKEDPGFRRLLRKHEELAERLGALQALRHPSEAEQLEVVKLKKQKLVVKDHMEQLLERSDD